MPDLTALGNVPTSYVHEDREVGPAADLTLPGLVLKWYHLYPRGEAVPGELDAAARALLTDEVAAGAFDAGYGLGFVVLHASWPLAYLIVGVWREHQELWETLYVADRAAGTPFARVTPGGDAPTLCAWELAPVWHERNAWVAYLRSARDDAAKRAYLADRLAGMV